MDYKIFNQAESYRIIWGPIILTNVPKNTRYKVYLQLLGVSALTLLAN